MYFQQNIKPDSWVHTLHSLCAQMFLLQDCAIEAKDSTALSSTMENKDLFQGTRQDMGHAKTKNDLKKENFFRMQPKAKVT